MELQHVKTVTASPSFYVRGIPIFGDRLLSPMDGYSDLPFRVMCRELGSAMSYTEFVNALDILKDKPYVHRRLAFLPQERPIVFQIFDSDPDRLLEAALRLQEYGPDIIDINMGCSDKSISARGAGAGLLRTPLKIARIFRKLSRSLEVPVTGKIRLGWDDDCRKYLLIARIIEENGGALLAVHGRTKQQAYSGSADWDAIAEISDSLKIPVIGNGDVRSVADARRLKEFAGCQAVMIGRAAIGNPWVFADLDREQVPVEQVRETMLRHLERSMSFYGPDRGLILFRKHASRYITPFRLPDVQRRRLLVAADPREFISVLEECIREPVI